RLHHLADQLLAGLVQADQRPLLVVGPVVGLQHVFHRTDELGVGLRRDAPLLPQPRLEFVFLSTCRTVSVEMVSTTSSGTSLPASSRNVQRSRPRGGSEQARATRRASPWPSSFRWRLGRSCFLRTRAASKPCSTNRWRTRSMVVTSTST